MVWSVVLTSGGMRKVMVGRSVGENEKQNNTPKKNEKRKMIDAEDTSIYLCRYVDMLKKDGRPAINP